MAKLMIDWNLHVAEFTFDELMRCGHVKRFQIVRTAREQSIAEHMWRVWAITSMILRAMQAPPMTQHVAQSWALMHDTPEVLTGDIATPAKEAMRKAVPEGDPVRNIELAMSDIYRDIWQESKLPQDEGWPPPYDIVKLADIIEAACFLGCEGLGTHANYVREELAERAQSNFRSLTERYPELKWGDVPNIVTKAWSRV